jgi:H+-translocating NAD(P) transhydrogenase subunit alpha
MPRLLRISQVWLPVLCIALAVAAAFTTSPAQPTGSGNPEAAVQSAGETASGGVPPSTAPGSAHHALPQPDYWSLLFVFLLATFIGVGVVRRVSRLLHTPLMSITNAISAIAVVGSIIVTGSDYPIEIRILGAVALFASTTNIVSGFLITDRMLKMFKTPGKEQTR